MPSDALTPAARVAHAFAPVAEAIAAGRIPGAVLGWVDASGARAVQVAGQAQTVPVPRPMTEGTWFDLASLTKPLFTARRIPRADVPSGDAFTAWIDQHWLTLDDAVDDLLHRVDPARSTAHTQE